MCVDLSMVLKTLLMWCIYSVFSKFLDGLFWIVFKWPHRGVLEFLGLWWLSCGVLRALLLFLIPDVQRCFLLTSWVLGWLPPFEVRRALCGLETVEASDASDGLHYAVDRQKKKAKQSGL